MYLTHAAKSIELQCAEKVNNDDFSSSLNIIKRVELHTLGTRGSLVAHSVGMVKCGGCGPQNQAVGRLGLNLMTPKLKLGLYLKMMRSLPLQQEHNFNSKLCQAAHSLLS